MLVYTTAVTTEATRLVMQSHGTQLWLTNHMGVVAVILFLILVSVFWLWYKDMTRRLDAKDVTIALKNEEIKAAHEKIVGLLEKHQSIIVELHDDHQAALQNIIKSFETSLRDIIAKLEQKIESRLDSVYEKINSFKR